MVPGLEGIAQEELRERLAGVAVRDVIARFDDRTSLILFTTAAPPSELVALRSVEDVFVLLADAALPSGRAGLAQLRAVVATSRRWDRALAAASAAHPRKSGRITYRVIARMAGEHGFRRVDAQHAAERGVAERFPNWRAVEDNARAEIWISLVRGRVLAALRISDNAMRHRPYLTATLPAALKPTIAAAMVLLSAPRDDDVFLDPMCGSGTILIERAHAGRYALLLGGDSDPNAVTVTTENVGRRYKPIELKRWDARRLPLDRASVSVIACNLPFGRQIGTPEGNRALYPALLEEWTRVLKPGGRMVLLSSERALLERSIRHLTELRVRRTVPMLVRGMRAAIVDVQRR